MSEESDAHVSIPSKDGRRELIARQVEQERLAMGFARAPSTTRASMVLAMVLAACVWPYRPAALVLGWLIIKLSVSSIRLYDLRLFEREQAPTLDSAAWERRFFRLVVLEASLWGAMGVLFMPADAPGVRTLVLASLVGIAAIGVFNLAVRSRQALIYMSLILLPCAALQLAQRDAAGVSTALAIGLYLFVLAREMRQSEGRLSEMLRLRFENAGIADERHQAMLLSEHASAAKSRFLAVVSHEMRTPLNGIMGMAQMLQRSPLADAQRRQLDIIGDSARHLQAVIGDLLDLSRIEFGKLKVDDAPLHLHDTVHEVTGLLQASAADKGLRFTLTLAPELPERVMGDASRIKQVLHNLLGNAIKFTAQGEVALDVGVDGDALRFEAIDTGDGVPDALHDRIFDAFEQGPAAAAPGRVGTGLGLTIARHLARAMGGDVVCAPTDGRGARFTFTLPCRVPAGDAAPAARASTPAGLPQLVGRVLVVDDNAVNAVVACSMLEHMGLAVEVAEDGEAALERMGRGGLDLVLMDCHLPGLDGWEATRRWRDGEGAGPRLPIVALTANAVAGDREHCLAAGMDDYLAKPVDLEQLADVVGAQLARRMLQRTG